MPERYGDAALYINPKNPGEIAHAIFRIASEPGLRQRLISNGYAQIAKWTNEDFQKKFLEVVTSVSSSLVRPQ